MAIALNSRNVFDLGLYAHVRAVALDSTHFAVLATDVGATPDVLIIHTVEYTNGVPTILDTVTTSGVSGEFQSIIALSSSAIVVAYFDDLAASNEISLKTYTLDGSFNITAADTITYDIFTTTGGSVSLAKIDSTHFALAYGDTGFLQTYVRTYSVDVSLNITQIDIQTTNETGIYPSLLTLNSNTLVMAYTGAGNDGYVRTITYDGSYNLTNVNTLEHNTSFANSNNLFKIDDTHFGLGYLGTGSSLKTFSIDGSKVITQEDSQDIGIAERSSTLVYESGKIVVAYTGSTSDGYVKTFTYDINYDLTLVDTLQYETNSARWQNVFYLGTDLVLVDDYNPGSGQGLSVSYLYPEATETTINANRSVFIEQTQPNTNYDFAPQIDVGESRLGSELRRGLVGFDLSSIPSGAIVTDVTFRIYNSGGDLTNNNRTFDVFRLKRDWVENQATWNIYSTGNSWQTAGALGANDYDSTSIGAIATVNPPSAGYQETALTASVVEDLIDGTFPNYGFLLKMQTEVDDMQRYEGSGDTNKPQLVITYAVASTITTQTQSFSSKANIVSSNINNYSSKANVVTTSENDFNSKSNIVKTITNNISVKSNILNTNSKDINSIANIVNTFVKDFSSKANIVTTTTNDFIAKASVVRTEIKDYSSKFNILTTNQFLFNSKASIANTIINEVESIANILKTKKLDFSVKASISGVSQFNFSSRGNILVSDNSFDLNAKASIVNTNRKDLSSKSNIITTESFGVSIKSNILNTVVKNYLSKANIIRSIIGNFNSKSNIVVTTIKEIDVIANISNEFSNNYFVKASISSSFENNIGSKANIIALQTKNLSSRAQIISEGASLIYTKSNIVRAESQQINSKSNIFISQLNNISLKANILTTEINQLEVIANIKAIKQSQISSKASIAGISQFNFNVKGNIFVADNIKNISSKASIRSSSDISVFSKANVTIKSVSDIYAKSSILETNTSNFRSKSNISIFGDKDISAKSNIALIISNNITVKSEIVDYKLKNIIAKADIAPFEEDTFSFQAKADIKLVGLVYKKFGEQIYTDINRGIYRNFSTQVYKEKS